MNHGHGSNWLQLASYPAVSLRDRKGLLPLSNSQEVLLGMSGDAATQEILQ